MYVAGLELTKNLKHSVTCTYIHVQFALCRSSIVHVPLRPGYWIHGCAFVSMLYASSVCR